MFTGIVEAVGRVLQIATRTDGLRVRIATPLGAELRHGDSIAVNGVCLTVVETDGSFFAADIGPETARITNLRALTAGAAVNLERPVRLGDRLDGHVVLGHVDATGRIEDIRPDGDSHWFAVGFPAALAPYLIRRGSVAVDGVSLTLAGLREAQFDVQVVPYTWNHTTLRTASIGDVVNLECDMIGKYVVRALELARGAAPTPPDGRPDGHKAH